MAKRFLSGRGGKVLVGSTDMNVTGWSFNPECKTEDTTNTGDIAADGNTYESHLLTTLAAKGNFKAEWDANNKPVSAPPNLQPGQSVALKLYFEPAGDYINIAAATITSLPIVSEVKGKISFTCEFLVNGTWMMPT